MPVKVIRVVLGQWHGDAETPELRHAPEVHGRLVVLDPLVADAVHRRLHRSVPHVGRCPVGLSKLRARPGEPASPGLDDSSLAVPVAHGQARLPGRSLLGDRQSGWSGPVKRGMEPGGTPALR
jgi:hypothetical protein